MCETIAPRLVEQAKVPGRACPDGRSHDLLTCDDKIADFGLRFTAAGTESYILQDQARERAHSSAGVDGR